MYDRPTAAELIAAAQQHFEVHIVPATRTHSHKLYFQTLVAVNVLKIVEREMTLHSAHFHAQWTRLNMLMDSAPIPPAHQSPYEALAARNQALCANIRAGHYDDSPALFEHLKACATEQLEVANPRYLAALRAEDTA